MKDRSYHNAELRNQETTENKEAGEGRSLVILSLTIFGVMQQDGGVQPLLHHLEGALPHFLLPVGGSVAPGTDTRRDFEDVHGPNLAESAFDRVF